MPFRFARLTGLLFLLLLLNSFYLAAFAFPTIFYMTNVLAHIGVGALVTLLFLWWLRSSADFRARVKWAILPLLAAAVLGAVLTYAGSVHAMRWVLWSHIALAFLGGLLIVLAFRSRVLSATFAGGGALCLAALGYQALFPSAVQRVVNTLKVPTSMEGEGGGPTTPFWPSSSKTNVGGTIPSNFFMDSKLCGECHKDIYDQWNSSMHHFASFNNQFYRKSIEHMQESQRHAGQQVVRRLPRPRGVLQWPVREARSRSRSTRRRRRTGSAASPATPSAHVRRLDGQRRLHHRVPDRCTNWRPATTRSGIARVRYLTFTESRNRTAAPS